MSITTFHGHYKQHSAALQWWRQKCEDAGNFKGYAFSPTYMTAVAAIADPKGPGFWFNEDDMREWSWWDLVAQLTDEGIELVVEDGVPGRGLTGCEIQQRSDSYDHSRHVNKADATLMREWDFVLKRNDKTAVRLHPHWGSAKVSVYPIYGQAATLTFDHRKAPSI